MKVVRLPSGPLACVYSLDEGQGDRETTPTSLSSGTFRAHSGSLQAEGETEAEALAVLDEQVRRVSVPPPDEPLPVSEPTTIRADESPWAMRVRKCGTQDSSRQSSSDADTPFDGVTLPPSGADQR